MGPELVGTDATHVCSELVPIGQFESACLGCQILSDILWVGGGESLSVLCRNTNDPVAFTVHNGKDGRQRMITGTGEVLSVGKVGNADNGYLTPRIECTVPRDLRKQMPEKGRDGYRLAAPIDD